MWRTALATAKCLRRRAESPRHRRDWVGGRPRPDGIPEPPAHRKVVPPKEGFHAHAHRRRNRVVQRPGPARSSSSPWRTKPASINCTPAAATPAARPAASNSSPGNRPTMTDGEKNVLAAKGVTGVRLSCQILCDHDMTVKVISRLAGSGRADAGKRPVDTLVIKRFTQRRKEAKFAKGRWKNSLFLASGSRNSFQASLCENPFAIFASLRETLFSPVHLRADYDRRGHDFY